MNLFQKGSRKLDQRMEDIERREMELKEREEALLRRTTNQRNSHSDKSSAQAMTGERYIQANPEWHNSFPKLSIFSGEEPRPRTEASYDDWLYEGQL